MIADCVKRGLGEETGDGLAGPVRRDVAWRDVAIVHLTDRRGGIIVLNGGRATAYRTHLLDMSVGGVAAPARAAPAAASGQK